jgi:two-component system, sensor histidine kinase LadS
VGEQKELIAAAIVRAQVDLATALAELEKLPAVDASSVAFAAHALNNYLTITGGVVELILQRLANHPDAQLQVWLEGVQHATDLMTHTVTQLMSASVTTETRLRFEKVDLPQLVQRTCNYYQRIADRKTIRVNFDAMAAVPPVWTDRVAVASVLDNFLSNAIKYSQPGKQIWVRMGAEQGRVVCEVRDEGPGLSQEDQLRLFQRGSRLTPRPTGGETSTGYGLAVAKELMEKLRGELGCTSELGHGCRFFFRLPAYLEPMPGSESQ